MGKVIPFPRQKARPSNQRFLVISRAPDGYKLAMRPALTNLERLAVTTHETFKDARRAAQRHARMFFDLYVDILDETGEDPYSSRGTIHVWAPDEEGGFLIGQESASGNSWGYFDTFPTAHEAIDAAYRLRDRLYNEALGWANDVERCAVHIPDAVLALLDQEGGDAA